MVASHTRGPGVAASLVAHASWLAADHSASGSEVELGDDGAGVRFVVCGGDDLVAAGLDSRPGCGRCCMAALVLAAVPAGHRAACAVLAAVMLRVNRSASWSV